MYKLLYKTNESLDLRGTHSRDIIGPLIGINSDGLIFICNYGSHLYQDYYYRTPIVGWYNRVNDYILITPLSDNYNELLLKSITYTMLKLGGCMYEGFSFKLQFDV